MRISQIVSAQRSPVLEGLETNTQTMDEQTDVCITMRSVLHFTESWKQERRYTGAEGLVLSISKDI